MFLPGYAEPILAMTGVGVALFLYGLWMVRQRQKELAEIEREQAHRPPAE